MIRSVITAASGLTLFAAATGPAIAQEDGVSEQDSPPTPRLEDGTVDLGGNGVWDLPWIRDFEEFIVEEGGTAPMLPWTRAMRDYNRANQSLYDPEGFCLPPGGPRAFGTPYPDEMIQHRDSIIVIY
ncbi:MAG: hypothetical protein F4053_13595 [Proteobacteria bacterium]|nr:hypothetical protein [Pseudomonadota bacterium]